MTEISRLSFSPLTRKNVCRSILIHHPPQWARWFTVNTANIKTFILFFSGFFFFVALSRHYSIVLQSNVFVSALHHIKLSFLSVTRHPQEEQEVSSRKESIINMFLYTRCYHIPAESRGGMIARDMHFQTNWGCKVDVDSHKEDILLPWLTATFFKCFLFITFFFFQTCYTNRVS